MQTIEEIYDHALLESLQLSSDIGEQIYYAWFEMDVREPREYLLQAWYEHLASECNHSISRIGEIFEAIRQIILRHDQLAINLQNCPK